MSSSSSSILDQKSARAIPVDVEAVQVSNCRAKLVPDSKGKWTLDVDGTTGTTVTFDEKTRTWICKGPIQSNGNGNMVNSSFVSGDFVFSNNGSAVVTRNEGITFSNNSRNNAPITMVFGKNGSFSISSSSPSSPSQSPSPSPSPSATSLYPSVSHGSSQPDIHISKAVAAPSLRQIDVSASGSLSVAAPALSPADTTWNIDSSAKMTILSSSPASPHSLNTVTASTSSSGKVAVQDNAICTANARLDASSSGLIAWGKNTITNSANLRASTSGKITAQTNTRQLRITTSLSGSVSGKGNVTEMEADVSSSGDLQWIGQCTNASLYASACAKISGIDLGIPISGRRHIISAASCANIYLRALSRNHVSTNESTMGKVHLSI